MAKDPMMGQDMLSKDFLWSEYINAQGKKLHNVEVVEFLSEHLYDKPKSSYFGFMKSFHKIFWHVKGEDVDRVSLLFICDPMKGTMKIHSICALNKNNILQLFVKDFMFLWVLFRWSLDKMSKCSMEMPLVPKQLWPWSIRYVWEPMYDEWDGECQFDLQGICFYIFLILILFAWLIGIRFCLDPTLLNSLLQIVVISHASDELVVAFEIGDKYVPINTK